MAEGEVEMEMEEEIEMKLGDSRSHRRGSSRLSRGAFNRLCTPAWRRARHQVLQAILVATTMALRQARRQHRLRLVARQAAPTTRSTELVAVAHRRPDCRRLDLGAGELQVRSSSRHASLRNAGCRHLPGHRAPVVARLSVSGSGPWQAGVA